MITAQVHVKGFSTALSLKGGKKRCQSSETSGELTAGCYERPETVWNPSRGWPILPWSSATNRQGFSPNHDFSLGRGVAEHTI